MPSKHKEHVRSEKNLMEGSNNKTAEFDTFCPLMLYEWTAKRRLKDVNKSLVWENKERIAKIWRIVLLGSHDL